MNTNKIYAEHIVNQYSAKKESKVVALKKLDREAKKPATIFGFTFGTISALIFGTGMSLAMGALGNGDYMALGIVIGVIGMIGCAISYPIYKKILENNKKKYASDIIRLAKEISEEE